VLCGGGDIVTHVDGRAVATTGDLRRALEAAGTGGTVRLGIVLGDGTAAVVRVRLAPQPDEVPDATTGC
jgi:S1-C subfamily serine protease